MIGSVARPPAIVPMHTMRPFGAAALTSAIDVVAADEIERDVRAAVGRLDDRPRERVDVERAVGGARSVRCRASSPSARQRSSLSAVRAVPTTCAPSALRELQRGGADARPDRVHEHPFARRDVRLRDHRVVRGDERLRDAAHRDEIEVRRARPRSAPRGPRRTRPARRRR